MTVTLTSPVLGKAVGETYTGDLEDWLLAQGYAKQDGYTGAGVSNTGVTDVTPDEDPTNAENREAPHWRDESDAERNASIANDGDNLNETSYPNPDFDFDEGGVNDDAPDLQSISPATGGTTGGTVVTLKGAQLTGTTGVTFGGTAGTALNVVDDETVEVTTPAKTAGAKDVVLTSATGSDTLVGGFTYA